MQIFFFFSLQVLHQHKFIEFPIQASIFLLEPAVNSLGCAGAVLLTCCLPAVPAPGRRAAGQPRRLPAVSARGPEAPGLGRLGPPRAALRVEEAAAAGGAQVPHGSGAERGLLGPPGPPAQAAGCGLQGPADQPVVRLQRGPKDQLRY